MLTFGRDYRRSATETRALNKISDPENGQCLIGWPDYQNGQVAVIFGTLFAAPRRFASPTEGSEVYDTYASGPQDLHGQIRHLPPSGR